MQSPTPPLGIWINDKLQPVTRSIPSYFKSSYILKGQLCSVAIPPNARLFTSDTVSVYTNIPTLITLHIIGDYLQLHAKDFSYPTNTLIAALEIVMQNSIFQFGDLFYKQLTGTAMGTPPAPPWATIFYGIHEIVILDEFKDYIFIYKRFIDDIIGI